MYVYVFTQPFHYEQDVRQGQFLSGVLLIWIQSFPFPFFIEPIQSYYLSICVSVW